MTRSFALLWATAALLAGGAARAEDHAPRVPPHPTYVQECAACHVAFPVGLLPATSWKRLMANLPQHFGTDASLDPATTQTLTTWLVANAGTGRRVSEAPAEDRITRGAWFVREHGEVGAAVWKRASIKSPANCGACHGGAAEGRYGEREIRIPK